LILAVLLPGLLAGSYFLIRHLGWFRSSPESSPESVLLQTFDLANSGRYEAATTNLAEGIRKTFHEDPSFMKDGWDLLTRNQTVGKVTIPDVNTLGEFAVVRFTIQYKDGSEVKSEESSKVEGGSWRYILGNTKDTLVRRFGDPGLLKRFPPELTEDYTSAAGAGLSLRVPQGSVFRPFKREFEHPNLRILIGVDYDPGRTYSHVLSFVEKAWRDPGTTLRHKEEIPADPRWKYVLFEGDRLNEQGTPWTQMSLVIGDERQAVHISALLPPWESVQEVVRRSLLSAKWQPMRPEDLLGKLDFDITPAQGFRLHDVRLELPGILFGPEKKDPADTAEARFVALKSLSLFLQENRSSAFEHFLKNVPDHFAKPNTTTIQPMKVGAFDGLEALGTIHSTKHDVSMFRYTAALFVNESMYCFEGTAPLNRQKEFENRFREMTRSFKIKGPQ
jgi:hypothetical protein